MREIGCEMKIFGGKVIFSELENNFTKIRNVSDQVQTSYIDFFIILV